MTSKPTRRSAGTRGILNPAAGFERFRLTRTAPPADLADVVDWFWIIRWELEEPFVQEVLPHPCVNVAFQSRAHVRSAEGAAKGSAVHGIGTRRDEARLEGSGRVVAFKMRPGGFHGFTRLAMKELKDRVIPLRDAFGARASGDERAVLGSDDDATSLDALAAFVRAHRPPLEAGQAEIIALAERAANDRTLVAAEDLARVAGASLRSLHRAFERFVGVGPKWVIRRARVQEAADRVAGGATVRWSALALELGYHDQAHLIRDFKAQVGFTPAVYAERCRRAAGNPRTASARRG